MGGSNPPYGEQRPCESSWSAWKALADFRGIFLDAPNQYGNRRCLLQDFAASSGRLTFAVHVHTAAGAPPNHYGEDQAQSYQQQGPPQQYQQGAPVHFQPQYEPNQPFYYKYSDCSGKRKALLIGINYTGTSAALRGCQNDVDNVSEFLTQRYNYRPEDMVILKDDPSFGYRQQPTRQNILEAMSWLVRGAQPNDSLFFHYSGHGGQAKDTNGDEEDGYDETIYPLDFKQAGMIVDDDMHAIMVRPLPAGCRLTAIFDSCHSGSALDLPYIVRRPSSYFAR